MIDKETIQIIQKIVNSRKRNTFAYYTEEDISQEIWILCIEALKSYDEKRGCLEHFLNTHISNRLKNLKRDKYFNPSKDDNSKVRINLVNAISIYDITFSENDLDLISIKNDNYTPLEKADLKETIENIMNNLPDFYVSYFKAFMDGEKIPKYIFDPLSKHLKGIIENGCS